ncbi:MAG: hypothetical protein GY790_07755 [Bacteroidetes bacterium]|nr:hypothetical protein [Bacteroidota bacterium]
MNQIKTTLSYIPGYLYVVCFLGAMSLNVNAQESRGKHQFLMYLTAPTMTFLDEDRSADLNIGDVAWTMEVGVQSKLYGLVGISGSLGYGGVKDHNSFTQSTTWGTLESSFTTLTYDFSTGIWSPLWYLNGQDGLSFTGGLSLGYEGISGRREIVNCDNCDVEKYSFNGGFFLEPELSFYFLQDLVGVGTSYRYFFGDTDLNGSWTILKLLVRFDLLNR